MQYVNADGAWSVKSEILDVLTGAFVEKGDNYDEIKAGVALQMSSNKVAYLCMERNVNGAAVVSRTVC